ncbi:MAG: histidine--tRNA ligase [Alphaproteobacteria bacterium]|nr:histidine--tRNA ligase [Alphaproteobacteria bacterium]
MSVHLAKGVRDYLPEQMRGRHAVMATVRAVFDRFGFEPLDTPAFERLDTLTGKYGDEGDKLMFRILQRGEGGEAGLADQALRYDLTVPLARFVAMHPELRLPFKRWQMAPVWRAERAQRGRFREFYQCDADIVGTTSPMADAECLAVASTAITELGFPDHVVRLNDRRILRAMARAVGAHDHELPLLIAVDKLDKIGRDGVSAEVRRLGLDDDAIARLWQILDVPRGHADTLDALAVHLDDEGRAGVDTLREVLRIAFALGVAPERLQVDPTLARGLDYYTGPVFETVLPGRNMGSVSGGGRYDGLVGMFCGRQIPCVGVSIGIERLLVLLEEEGRLEVASTAADVLVTVHDDDHRDAALAAVAALRAAGVRAEVFLDDKKLKAQLKYANARGYRWVAFVGPEEAAAGQVTLKDFAAGKQVTVPLHEAASVIGME